MASVPARKRGLTAYVRTSYSLQKSASSIPASNKLSRSAPKRVAVRVNGGLVGETHWRESVSEPRRRKDGWCVGLRRSLSREKGEGPAKTQDDVRASSSGRLIRQKRAQWGGRGTGAVKATGSWEESLSVEGTSGCHEPSPFTRRWSRRPWRLPHAGRQKARESTMLVERYGAPRFCGEGRGDRGVRGSIAVGAVGRRLPRSFSYSEECAKKRQGSACPSAVRRSVLGCRETPGSLVSRSEPKTPRGEHAVKAA